MDTSETYIKMCERAEEIQKLRPRLISMRDFYDTTDLLIWLPRQDQLQKILKEDNRLYWGDRVMLTKYLHQFALNWDCVFSSMEQLWLAFVMRERYNKAWDGEKWVIKLP